MPATQIEPPQREPAQAAEPETVIMLNRAAIMGADDRAIVPIDVPEWGGRVYVRGMTGQERDDWEARCTWAREQAKSRGCPNVRARLAVATVCTADGELMFNESDIDWLGKKSGAVLDRIWDAAAKLSGIGAEEEKALAKNSEPDPSEDSASG